MWGDRMKILVTAFDPFGGDDTNSSELVLNLLPDEIENVIIKKMVVPTVYKECAFTAFNEAVKENCDVIISLGQAGGRDHIAVETVAVNYALANLGDNRGTVLNGEKLFDNGENAYFATIPVKEIVSSVRNLGFNANLSISAGGFVCNSMLYTLLKNVDEAKMDIKCGFIHLPYLESQGKSGFCMKDEDVAICVKEALNTVIKYNVERNNE